MISATAEYRYYCLKVDSIKTRIETSERTSSCYDIPNSLKVDSIKTRIETSSAIYIVDTYSSLKVDSIKTIMDGLFQTSS